MTYHFHHVSIFKTRYFPISVRTRHHNLPSVVDLCPSISQMSPFPLSSTDGNWTHRGSSKRKKKKVFQHPKPTEYSAIWAAQLSISILNACWQEPFVAFFLYLSILFQERRSSDVRWKNEYEVTAYVSAHAHQRFHAIILLVVWRSLTVYFIFWLLYLAYTEVWRLHFVPSMQGWTWRAQTCHTCSFWPYKRSNKSFFFYYKFIIIR